MSHEYRGTGRYSSKFDNFGYRWVPGTEKILEEILKLGILSY